MSEAADEWSSTPPPPSPVFSSLCLVSYSQCVIFYPGIVPLHHVETKTFYTPTPTVPMAFILIIASSLFINLLLNVPLSGYLSPTYSFHYDCYVVCQPLPSFPNAFSLYTSLKRTFSPQTILHHEYSPSFRQHHQRAWSKQIKHISLMGKHIHKSPQTFRPPAFSSCIFFLCMLDRRNITEKPDEHGFNIYQTEACMKISFGLRRKTVTWLPIADIRLNRSVLKQNTVTFLIQTLFAF